MAKRVSLAAYHQLDDPNRNKTQQVSMCACVYVCFALSVRLICHFISVAFVECVVVYSSSAVAATLFFVYHHYHRHRMSLPS